MFPKLSRILLRVEPISTLPESTHQDFYFILLSRPYRPPSHTLGRSPDTFFFFELNIHEKEKKSRGACVSLFRLFVKLWKKRREKKKGELDILRERAALFFVLLLLLLYSSLFSFLHKIGTCCRGVLKSHSTSQLFSRAPNQPFMNPV